MEETGKAKVRDYRDLIAWQKSIELVKSVYALTRKFPKAETYSLADQLQRAAISVPSNIAEGQSRQHGAEFRQFLHIALGSTAEVDTQIVIAEQLGYITKTEQDAVYLQLCEVRRLIRGLVSSIK